MSFAERHLHACGSNDLTDDAVHHQVEVLQASGLADRYARDIGSLLHRVKYGNGMKRCFEGDAHSMAQLEREWRAIVEKKARARHWIKPADWPKIGHLFPRMVEKVAQVSLAHYLASNCPVCTGTGSKREAGVTMICPACKGSKIAQIASTPECKLSAYEIELARQMSDELLALEQVHAGVASVKLRREA
jgi:ribosomal protein L37AE/L43A